MPAPNRDFIACVAGLSLAAALLVWFSTRWGIGISPDSTTYLQAARQIAAGRGYTVPTPSGDEPVAIAPPLFPAVLALGGAAGADPAAFCRVLHAAVFGLCVALTAVVLRRAPGGGIGPAVMGACLTATSVDLLGVCCMAWSEPLFLLLMLAGVYGFIRYDETGARAPLAGFAAAFGAALMTRYVGAALVGAGAVLIALRRGKTLGRRLADLAVFLCISCLPMALWLVRNSRLGGSASGQRPGGHLPDWLKIRTAIMATGQWLVPLSSPVWLRFAGCAVVVAAACAAAAWLLARRARGGGPVRGWTPSEVFLVMAAAYLGFVVVTMSFIDVNVVLDYRLLSAALVFGILTGCRALGAVWRRVSGRGARRLIGAGCTLLVLYGAGRAALLAADYHSEGIGFASRQWRESKLLMRLGAEPSSTAIFTNGADLIEARLGRHARPIPHRWVSPFTREPALGLEAEFDALRREMAGRRVLVAYLAPLEQLRPEFATRGDLEARLPLRRLYEGPDGVLYESSGGGR